MTASCQTQIWLKRLICCVAATGSNLVVLAGVLVVAELLGDARISSTRPRLQTERFDGLP
jgi:hypothetical protein